MLLMGRTCCVVNGHYIQHVRRGLKIDNGLYFYCFPAWKQNGVVSDVSKRRWMAWISEDARTYSAYIPSSLKVCSRHFHSAYEMDKSHPDWAPNLHQGHRQFANLREAKMNKTT
ncbi:hypothetical protein UPYG_G00022910 [Umbra pygmaea]|uniref:THAP-type domain-containing protein n=1 Tax=Umbra pygmaea TaxID=75934 RepID=A0ABD0Y580_UMBPY